MSQMLTPFSRFVKVGRVLVYDHAPEIRVPFFAELCALEVAAVTALVNAAVRAVLHHRDILPVVNFGARAVYARDTKVITAPCVLVCAHCPVLLFPCPHVPAYGLAEEYMQEEKVQEGGQGCQGEVH